LVEDSLKVFSPKKTIWVIEYAKDVASFFFSKLLESINKGGLGKKSSKTKRRVIS
jgi:hypothetical protein